MPSLIDVSTCNLHKVHNAFDTGLAVFGSDAKDLALTLFYWFKRPAAHREDFKKIQFQLDLDDVILLWRVSNRWLSLQPAATIILNPGLL